MVPFLDALIRKTKISGYAIGGALVAILGMYLLSGLDLSEPQALVGGRIGDLWTLLSAFGYAVYLVLLQKHLNRFGHWSFLTAQLIVVSVTTLTLGPFIEDWNLELTHTSVLAAVVYCSIFATVGTGLLQFKYQAQSSPVHAALIFALEPVFAGIFAMILLSENPGKNALIGGALIIVGVLIAEIGPNLKTKLSKATD